MKESACVSCPTRCFLRVYLDCCHAVTGDVRHFRFKINPDEVRTVRSPTLDDKILSLVLKDSRERYPRAAHMCSGRLQVMVMGPSHTQHYCKIHSASFQGQKYQHAEMMCSGRMRVMTMLLHLPMALQSFRGKCACHTVTETELCGRLCP